MKDDAMLKNIEKVPKFENFFSPTMDALKKLGGSATVDELVATVIEIMKLPEDIASIPHSETDTRTRLEYRLAWARTYLKRNGLIDNSAKGVWSLTQKGLETAAVDSSSILKGPRTRDQRTVEVEIEKTDIDEWRDIA